jgi:hypothetical protein
MPRHRFDDAGMTLAGQRNFKKVEGEVNHAGVHAPGVALKLP